MFEDHYRTNGTSLFCPVSSHCPFKQMEGAYFPYMRMVAAFTVRRRDLHTEEAVSSSRRSKSTVRAWMLCVEWG